MSERSGSLYKVRLGEATCEQSAKQSLYRGRRLLPDLLPDKHAGIVRGRRYMEAGRY
jgi:hypothetical protein